MQKLITHKPHIPQLLIQIEYKRMALQRSIPILFFIAQSVENEVRGVFFDFAKCVGVLRGGVEPAEIGETQAEGGDEGAVGEILGEELVIAWMERGRRRRRRPLAEKKRNSSREREAEEQGQQIDNSTTRREIREDFFEGARENFKVLVLDA
ncbi:hypothetical protein BCON_1570g00020 [Botryotinia convoluta]|uniref:Uncharacterized protein n=1 Tax=Botryotinia convoluta TaxID=54673 RepID=A0A4Z1H663_9HELO|nr:hypothetical protein BCON_1570g00020 [Botryotinia convoluta]